MTFGDPSRAMSWTLPEAQALPILKRAFDLGINTWDTVILHPFHIISVKKLTRDTYADTYSNGDSERIIGKALREYRIPRERVVLLSKCYAGLPEDTENLDEGELLKRTSVNDGVMANRVGLSRKHIFDAVDA